MLTIQFSHMVCKDTTLLTYRAAITQYTYVEGPPPLYIAYVSPEQKKGSISGVTRNSRAMNQKGTKVNERKQWKELTFIHFLRTRKLHRLIYR